MVQEVISYQIDGKNFKGYLAFPKSEEEGVQHFPTVIVAHAWMGQDQFARHKAEQLAQLGYIGFAADIFEDGVTPDNSSMLVKNITSGTFSQQISSFAVNPGDDMATALQTTINTVMGWSLSDLFGRLKLITLSSTDPSGYTYENQIDKVIPDISDKEYINQVTVIGTGVSAIARSGTSIGATTRIRDSVIVDYKITTLSDAQSRADYELQNASKFNNQAQVNQIVNPGSEIFDIITVINADANISGTYRIYNQDEGIDGQSSSYAMQIGAGEV